MFRSLLPALVLVTLGASGCTCGPLAEGKLFGCESSFDCTVGFNCVAGVCRASDSPGGDSGTDAGLDGGTDAGRDAGADAGFDAGTDAGFDAGFDAGTDAGTDAGIDAGFDAGVQPTKLTLDSPPQTARVYDCSSAIQVSTRNDADASIPVTAPTTLNLGPTSALRFFTTAGCNGGDVTSVPLAANNSAAQFYVRALDAGVIPLTVSATSLATATQNYTANYRGIADGGFTGLPRTERAGDCAGPITFTLYDDQNLPTKSATALNVGLSYLPVPGLSFYASAGCTSAPTNTVMLAPGQGSVNFWIKGLTGRGYFVGANVPGAFEITGITILPAVRSFACQLDDGGTTLLCPIAQPQVNLNNTFLSVQSTSSSATVGESSLVCDFVDAGLVSCVRGNAGSNVVYARIQTVELPQAIVGRGRSVNFSTAGLPTVLPADRDRTFSLVTSSDDGSQLDESDLILSFLNDAGTVELTHGPSALPATVSVQLVTLPGLQVFRGLASMFGLTRLQLPTGGVKGDLALTTARGTPAAVTGLCDRFIRTEVLDAGLVFTRTCGTTDAGLSWERLSPGDAGTAVTVVATLHAGEYVVTVPLPRAIDPTRTWLFTTGQAVGGQSGGEAAALGDTATTDVLGEATVLLTTDGGSVRLERASAGDAGTWTVQGFEFGL